MTNVSFWPNPVPGAILGTQFRVPAYRLEPFSGKFLLVHVMFFLKRGQTSSRMVICRFYEHSKSEGNLG